MRLRVKRPDDLELNLISLVDVVLLLVIFFMLSTTFIQDARLRVELPEAGSATPDRSYSRCLIFSSRRRVPGDPTSTTRSGAPWMFCVVTTSMRA